MITDKLKIALHDRSLVVLSRTDGGALYVELFAPGSASDGHGYICKGSTLLAEDDRRALITLLTLEPEGGKTL